ncbi:GGDEF domain-containing protein [Sporosarcina contaminans]|uniref:GGDEF domain-containing protein n=1 Tax=Sporosarcina contaminans TaxID=633403 RepID=A0ABW3TWZ1_9BACL
MKVTKTQKWQVYALWVAVVPISFVMAFHFFPTGQMNYVNLSINLLILIAIMMLPIAFDNVTITLERWVIFTVFFNYGILAEMIFMQVAMLVLLFTQTTNLSKVFRFSVNSIIFAIVSLVSGSVYYLVGGTPLFENIGLFALTGFIYASLYSIINSLLLFLYFKFRKLKTTDFRKAARWDYISSMLLLPFAISFCLLLQLYGNKAFFLIGIPFLIVLLVTRKFLKSDQLQDVLSSAAAIGHQLSDQLLVDDVLQTFTGKLRNVVPYESAYIVDLRIGENLKLLTAIEGKFRVSETNRFSFPMKKTDKDGLNMDETKLYVNKKSIASLIGYQFAPSVESVLTAPIKRNRKTEGFLILTSTEKFGFTDIQGEIVTLLAGYFAVAVEKARYYERTVEKSIRCGLTNLHNFRFLEEKLNEEVIRFHTNEINSLSVIILDIDLFKGINDSYGHQSGNDLLIAFANLLRDYQTDDITLARYGGEEFVLLLPNYSKDEAIEMAEEIRRTVEQSNFVIMPDLGEAKEPTVVQMTISAGVATFPEDASNGKELMRNVDRALYIGGKQAGRNKVGIYVEENTQVTIN